MHFRNSFIAALTLVASNASAGLVRREAFNELFPRQTTNACTSTCAPFQANLNTCTTTGCICTATVAGNLQRCVDCAVSVKPTAKVIADATALVDTYQETCKGISLPTVTVAGSTGASTGLFTDTTLTDTDTDTAFTTTSRSIPAVITTITTNTLTQVVVGPSSTALATGSGSDSSTVGSPSSGYAVSVSKGVVVAIGAALGMSLIY